MPRLMRVVFLGPPGAGKGTQAQRFCAKHGVPQISTGDLFRAAAASGTGLGKEAKGYMDRGELVPDSVVCGLVAERLRRGDCARGFVFDGFPRTIAQAEELDRVLHVAATPLQACVEFDVSRSDLVRRLTRRLTCRSCGAVRSMDGAAPKQAGRCDACGGELYVRDDDKPETVERRLREYDAKTAPLAEYYAGRGLLIRLDAGRSPDEVAADLDRRLSVS
jgi:adenylate kinase